MQKKHKKRKNNIKLKSIKIEPKTHKLLKIYATNKGMYIPEAARVLINKAIKKK